MCISTPMPQKQVGGGGTCNGTQCGGPWTPTESALHINVLEIKAAFFTLKCFVHKLSNNHVRINIDNTTAVSSINHMGLVHRKSHMGVSSSYSRERQY